MNAVSRFAPRINKDCLSGRKPSILVTLMLGCTRGECRQSRKRPASGSRYSAVSIGAVGESSRARIVATGVTTVDMDRTLSRVPGRSSRLAVLRGSLVALGDPWVDKPAVIEAVGTTPEASRSTMLLLHSDAMVN